MTDLARPMLDAWANFYVIVGSSAGALIGLQFVVIALVSERRKISNLTTIDAFATPTIVHFCCVLVLAAMLSAPWTGIGPVAIMLGLLGLFGLGYTAVVARRTGKAGEYTPVFEDILWHIIIPAVAYALIVLGAILLPRRESWELFAIGAASLLLLFAGIHNAWDTVTFIMTSGGDGS